VSTRNRTPTSAFINHVSTTPWAEDRSPAPTRERRSNQKLQEKALRAAAAATAMAQDPTPPVASQSLSGGDEKVLAATARPNHNAKSPTAALAMLSEAALQSIPTKPTPGSPASVEAELHRLIAFGALPTYTLNVSAANPKEAAQSVSLPSTSIPVPTTVLFIPKPAPIS
jgi:hypothetical protein